MKKTLLTYSLIVSSFFSVLAQMDGQSSVIPGAAGTVRSFGPLGNLLKMVSDVLSNLAPILISLAVLAFFWYIVQFIWKGGESAEKRGQSIKGMGYSILALFVMVSIWGIITLMGSIVGISPGGSMPGFTLPGAKS